MPTPQIFNSFKAAGPNGLHNFASNTLKVALTNVQPSLTDVQLSDITEIAVGGGYVTGGTAIAVTSSTQTGGTYSLVLEAVSFTPVGTDIADFRYPVLYDDTSADDKLICFFDEGAPITLTAGGAPYTIHAGTWMTNA